MPDNLTGLGENNERGREQLKALDGLPDPKQDGSKGQARKGTPGAATEAHLRNAGPLQTPIGGLSPALRKELMGEDTEKQQASSKTGEAATAEEQIRYHQSRADQVGEDMRKLREEVAALTQRGQQANALLGYVNSDPEIKQAILDRASARQQGQAPPSMGGSSTPASVELEIEQDDTGGIKRINLPLDPIRRISREEALRIKEDTMTEVNQQAGVTREVQDFMAKTGVNHDEATKFLNRVRAGDLDLATLYQATRLQDGQDPIPIIDQRGRSAQMERAGQFGPSIGQVPGAQSLGSARQARAEQMVSDIVRKPHETPRGRSVKKAFGLE